MDRKSIKKCLRDENCRSCQIVNLIIFETPENAKKIIEEHGCELQIKDCTETATIEVITPKSFSCPNYEKKGLKTYNLVYKNGNV
jgi:hypothetical protein